MFAFCLAVTALFLLTSVRAYAKDHSSEYEVGVFSATGQLSDGSFAVCHGGMCSTHFAGHNIHYVRTPRGMYGVEAPIAKGTAFANAMLTGGLAPVAHQEWFMDQLHEGDKVLLAVKCNKHNDCTFWIPNPDHVGKEYSTFGFFRPDVAKTNTQTLCGTGKLSPAVEAQVCGQNDFSTPPMVPASSATPASTPSLVTAAPSPASPASTGTPHTIAASQEFTDPQHATDLQTAAADPQAIDQLVQAGEASRGAVFTVPFGAEVYIDGKRVGVTPYAFVLMRNGEIPHTITVVKDGYAKIEKSVTPDGTTIRLELTLERQQQND
jgi:hypothetical protein